MKRVNILFPAATAFFLLFFFSSSVFALQPTLHTINFGGSLGHNYSPNVQTVEVGDTIVWNGDFSTYPMDSTIVPADAAPLGPVFTGTTYTYIIEVSGTYYFRNKTWGALGMTGSINGVFKPHGSLTNAGREFYLGLLYPTYNYIAPSSLFRQYIVYALLTTYYDNVIYVSYYDASGTELTPKKYIMSSRSRLQITLDAQGMRLDSNVETPAYKACHIVSKYPISVQYLSHGANAGGSYLALPTLAVGKKYVIGSYKDDATEGALPKGNGIPAPDIAGGTFMIIATQDVTGVNIIPTTPTSTGKSGGFGTTLSKGQCYLVRSDGKLSDHDLSGTMIEASKPIIVISGHEDAFIGDGSNTSAEQRNSLIEQLIPYEYWDSAGYIGIPFTSSGNPGTNTGGIGDLYRVYTQDPGVAKVQADVGGIAGGYDMSTSAPHFSEKAEITSPVDIYSTNGHKISVMQYDERSQGAKAPYPAPSMMTIVPHSRWRTNYNFSEFDPAGIAGVNSNQYVGVIADSLQTIKVSVDGAPEGPISNLGGSLGTYYGVSNRYTSSPITGGRYEAASHSFYLHSEYPFIIYTYGMSNLNYGFGMFGNYQYNYEYSSPAGMQLNTGIPPSFKVTVDEHADCSGWHVCVVDTGTTNPGVRAVMFVDDTEAIYFRRPGVKFKNVSFDSSSTDFTAGELHPFMESSQQYCFDIRIDNRLAESKAPIGIIDNNGNGLLIQLHRSAPTFKLATRPPVQNPNSILFSTKTIGTTVADTFVVHNTASAGGSSLTFLSAVLKKGDAAYKIVSMTPSLPAAIKAQDSLTIIVSYTAKDSLRHQDTLLITNGCFTVPIALDAHSSTGIISASDISDFGNVSIGKEQCKTLQIQNIGSAPFMLLASPVLSDNVNFAIDPDFLKKLPFLIQPAGKITVNVCFHPQKATADSTGITWLTDISAEFINSGKNYSTLMGAGLDTATKSVRGNDAVSNSLSVRPNPASGTSAMVTFTMPGKERASLNIYDLLGREVFSVNLRQGTGEIEIPIGYLPRGVYQVRITADDVVLTQKLEVVR